MSLEAMTWVYARAPIPAHTDKGEPSPSILASVLLCLADGYSEDTGLAFRGVRGIAGRTRCDERTVRRALRALEKYGLIREAEDQSIVAARVKRADQRPVGYELMLHLDNFGAHLPETDRAYRVPDQQKQTGGRAAPSQEDRGGERPPRDDGNGGVSGPQGASSPERGGERSATGGRLAPQTQEELKMNPRGGLSPEGGTSLGAAIAENDPPSESASTVTTPGRGSAAPTPGPRNVETAYRRLDRTILGHLRPYETDRARQLLESGLSVELARETLTRERAARKVRARDELAAVGEGSGQG